MLAAVRSLLGSRPLPSLVSSLPLPVPHAHARSFHLSSVAEAKKKQRVVAIRLVSAAGTGFAYTTQKKAALGKKLQLRKYDPVLRRHVWFLEEKISRKRIVQRRR